MIGLELLIKILFVALLFYDVLIQCYHDTEE